MLSLLTSTLLAQGDEINLNIGEQARDIIPHAETVVEQGGGAGMANLISALLEVALLIAGILVLLFLVWGAVEWIAAGGESSKIEKARNKITQAIIGIIVLSATIAVFNLVQTFLGVTLINFGNGIGGSGGSGGGGSEATGCLCWNGEYASIGQVGRLTYDDDSNCYRCTNSGWTRANDTESCGIIDCQPR
ncbi:MAG: hypothetical protein GF381_03520 [Candidatus Pacebacteria bacterium]|nr:hypothetical protein [Candidatus Paceibacterota bacterium]